MFIIIIFCINESSHLSSESESALLVFTVMYCSYIYNKASYLQMSEQEIPASLSGTADVFIQQMYERRPYCHWGKRTAAAATVQPLSLDSGSYAAGGSPLPRSLSLVYHTVRYNHATTAYDTVALRAQHTLSDLQKQGTCFSLQLCSVAACSFSLSNSLFPCVFFLMPCTELSATVCSCSCIVCHTSLLQSDAHL